jgi:hypothetical protein
MIIHDLSTLKKHLAIGIIQENDIIPIMTIIRNELENNNEKQNYKFLNLFCNWCVHPKITRSMEAFEMIELLTEAIAKYNQSEGKSISNCIKTICESFYYDLKTFFIVNGLNLRFFDDTKPHMPFFFLVIKVIVNRPIEMPDEKFIEKKKLKDRKKRITDLMKNLSPNKHNLTPQSIIITEGKPCGKTNYYLGFRTEKIIIAIPMFNPK